MVVLVPLNCGRASRFLIVERSQRRLQHVVGAADVDDDAVLIEPFGQERRAHHEGRAVQFLRGAEHLAAKRMRDHDLVGTSTANTGTPLAQCALQDSGSAGSARRRPRRGSPAGAPAGRRRPSPAPATHRAPDRRAAPAPPSSRRACVQRGRCEGATLPTWLETSRSRRLWNASPSGAATSPAPYQLISTIVASSPAQRSAVARPAPLPLAWKTRSHSAGAASASQSRRRALAASSARAGAISTTRDLRRPAAARTAARPEGRPTPPPTTAMRSAGPGAPSQTALSAVSMLAASTARAGGTPSGTAHHRLGRHREQALMRMEREHHAVRATRPLLDPADRRIAVFDRERKRAAHEGRPHALKFARRHAALADQPLGAAADRAVERPHPHLAGGRRPPPPPRAVRRGPARHTRAPWPAIDPIFRHVSPGIRDSGNSAASAISSSGRKRHAKPLHGRTVPPRRRRARRAARPARRCAACCSSRWSASSIAGLICALRRRAVARRLRRRRSRAGGAVRGDAAVDGDRLLERDHRRS